MAATTSADQGEVGGVTSVSLPNNSLIGAGRGRSRRARRLRHHLTVLSFIAPALIGICIFLIYPLVSATYFSFTQFGILGVPEWVGLRNYRHLLDDPNVATSVKNTLWLVAVMVPARILMALGTGLLL